MVWISHGSADGILAKNTLISWKSFSDQIRLTPGRDFVLACYSSCLEHYVSPEAMIGVGGPIDAILGGLVASYLLMPREQVLAKAWERLSDGVRGIGSPEQLLVTYVYGHLSTTETIDAVADLAALIADAALGEAAGEYLHPDMGAAASRLWEVTVAIILSLVNVMKDFIPWGAFVDGQAGNINSIIQDTISHLQWYEWLTLVGLSIVGAVADAFGVGEVGDILLVIDVTLFLANLWVDFNDLD